MSGKNQFPNTFYWQSTNPQTGFLPTHADSGSIVPIPPVPNGVMSGTNTIWSNIISISKFDNQGLEVTWTGTPTGTFQVLVSNSGINFYALTYNPALAQPSGSAGGYVINNNQLPFKFIQLQYTNTSGSGILTVYSQQKDLN